MNKYALNDHSITCPCCLQEYSKLDSPHEYARVLHIVDPCHDQKERVARLSAEILATGKLPSMSKEEEGELKANLTVKDLPKSEQDQILDYLSTGVSAFTPEVKARLSEDAGSYLEQIRSKNILEQVCLGLRELGVDCSFAALTIKVELVAADDFCLLFCHGAVTWEGFGYFLPLAHWVSDVPNSCCDVPRIVKSIFTWIKRFDYREYRGNK